MANYSIEMIKINDFQGFDAKEFCIKPSYWGYEWQDDDSNILEEAKELAKSVNDICVALVHTPTGDFVLGESCSKGCSSKFILFNAVDCSRINAEVRAIVFNTGRGALTNYWWDHFLQYEPGAMI